MNPSINGPLSPEPPPAAGPGTRPPYPGIPPPNPGEPLQAAGAPPGICIDLVRFQPTRYPGDETWEPWAVGLICERMCHYRIPDWYPAEWRPGMEMRLRMVLGFLRISEHANNERVCLSALNTASRDFRQIQMEIQAAAENLAKDRSGNGQTGGGVSGNPDTKELNTLRSEKSGHGPEPAPEPRPEPPLEAAPPASTARTPGTGGEPGEGHPRLPPLTRQQRRRLDRQLRKNRERLEKGQAAKPSSW